jgi:hypothetical protein
MVMLLFENFNVLFFLAVMNILTDVGFPSHLLVAGLSTSMFCLLFTRAIKSLFPIYTLFVSRWALKDVT